ncbi:hypothetical protein Tco_1440643 [Tanacetum coccineum]
MADDLAADSWEAADIDVAMTRLMLNPKPTDVITHTSPTTDSVNELLLEDSVDQFLREALQNPRERLSVISPTVYSVRRIDGVFTYA